MLLGTSASMTTVPCSHIGADEEPQVADGEQESGTGHHFYFMQRHVSNYCNGMGFGLVNLMSVRLQHSMQTCFKSSLQLACHQRLGAKE